MDRMDRLVIATRVGALIGILMLLICLGGLFLTAFGVFADDFAFRVIGIIGVGLALMGQATSGYGTIED